MYIPIFKNRSVEISVIKKLNYCLDDSIIPLIEIIDDFYVPRYLIDPVTKEYIKTVKEGKKRASKVKLEPMPEDVITFNVLENILSGKKAFIDYLRYTTEEYGKNINVDNLRLSRKLSVSAIDYREHLYELSNYDNLIPVVSIKNGFDDGYHVIEELILELQKRNDCVAIRIQDSFIEKYIKILTNLLRTHDYLLVDIGNNKLASKEFLLSELLDASIESRKVVLTSPRDSKMRNYEYPDCSVAESIDTSAARDYKNVGFDGFGDYCGYKNVLPTTARSKGEGAALAVLYNYDDNAFYTFVNYETKDGVQGYRNVVNKIIDFTPKIMNNYDNCPAFIKIREYLSKPKCGSWKDWNNITMTRYLHQIYINKNT